MPDTPAPTATYLVTNDNGNLLRTIPKVLAEVRQTGCETTDTSNVLTVEDSTVLYPGMGVCCSEVPEGTYLLAIKSATEVVLSAPAGATEADLVVCFKGLVWVPVSRSADRGSWRNTINGTQDLSTGSSGSSLGIVATRKMTGPCAISPKTFSEGGLPTDYNVHLSDELLDDPVLRVKTEQWGFWMLVSTGGHISVVPFDPDHSLHLKELVAAA